MLHAAGFREVDVHYAAYHMQDSPDMEIIDVRSPVEYQTGHIAGEGQAMIFDCTHTAATHAGRIVAGSEIHISSAVCAVYMLSCREADAVCTLLHVLSISCTEAEG